MLFELETIAQTVQHRLRDYQVGGHTITLKFPELSANYRSKTLASISLGKSNLHAWQRELFGQLS